MYSQGQSTSSSHLPEDKSTVEEGCSADSTPKYLFGQGSAAASWHKAKAKGPGKGYSQRRFAAAKVPLSMPLAKAGEPNAKDRESGPESPHSDADPSDDSQQDEVIAPPFESTDGSYNDDTPILSLPSAKSSTPEAQAADRVDDDEPPTYPDEIPAPPRKYYSKLNSNYVPSLPEVLEIKHYVNVVDEKLVGFDEEIAELAARLEELNNKRARVQEVRDAHQALISPVRRLPPEVLQMIFVWCLPQNRNAVMHATEAPVLLGRICSEWRRISLSTPEVWSTLHIVPPNVNFSNPTSSETRFKRKRDIIEMWLARSGACPLSISVVWFAGESEDEIKLCATLLEVLVPLCKRWRSLDFQVPLKMFKPFRGLTVEDVPLLEGMSLMDNRTPLDVEVNDRWPDTLNFVENSPRLRHFGLTFFSGGIKLPSIPWSQLSTLYLESNIAFFFSDSREMLSTLSQCSSLWSLILKFPLSHTAPLPPYEKLDTPITLPQLEILCLDGDQHLQNTFHMSNTLANICAPKLRKLEILGRSGRPEGCSAPEPLSAIRKLFERSKCPLEKLNVESMTLLPDEFIACLSLVPDLKELSVHNWAVKMFTPTPPAEETEPSSEPHELAENMILKALTIRPEEDRVVNLPASSSSTNQSGASLEEGRSSGTSPALGLSIDIPILCPNLQKFDFTLCDASQKLLCDFVESRWNDLPQGVCRLQSVKSNFTAFEEEPVKVRMEKMKADGLDVHIAYQVPINDDVNPSPWTGLEGPVP
ncbi:hypothetical protein CVT26_001844 [Gymnopilus dilepis]|uniref:Uncharacterized protein n=1 Tax=Gymnopilus dilepis TaxID=231916 RepID=A0A409VRI8_9AGAR|nr:hypothetical protein CVT26_001844 [Gymnopilus dilepis]